MKQNSKFNLQIVIILVLAIKDPRYSFPISMQSGIRRGLVGSWVT